MRQQIISLSVALLFITVLKVHAQTPGSGMLAGLKEARIEASLTGPWSERFGLSDESVKSQILVELRRDLPKLKIDAAAPSVVVAHADLVPLKNLYGMDDGSYLVTVSVDVMRPALIAGDEGAPPSSGIAGAWLMYTGFVSADASGKLRSEIQDMLTQMIADYYRENPD